MSGRPIPTGGGRARRTKLAVPLMVLAGLVALLLANARLVFLAVRSEPACVAHLQMGSGAAAAGLAAAQSACTPAAPATDGRGEGKQP
jgi:hypothetical protein